ncbi:Na/Pi cotransporter family protein [Clostridium fallax]|uniref:Phosphate uptake regulator, PhoU n=1 Tax=Clostridium fallax TaxID=1533 RepID=A0A1M4TSG5_9CLOT|nr:Na/Pi cotransporter family protein [Clostridium fallax]SHE47335.1 phosphate uptake regulator, PhoU [Clostridium fallax]SQB22420.1 Na/Pi-cotransporter family protein/PhoU family protein [Clostridium fallax]
MDATKIIIQLIGGLGLFLYGMKLMGDGLENSAGDKLKGILEKVTTNPFSAVAVGAIVTAIIQSSSATTVMVVGFVNAGLMNLFQAAGIIMGANIGTTITAQLVAFKLDDIAPIFVGVGTLIVLFAKGKKRKDIGNIVLGFGILFMGMGVMSGAMKPISQTPQFNNLILAVQGNWILGILTGLLLTAVFQSSSATTAILIALASTGQITLDVAVPILFGCNIGTCITALIASVGTNKTAHKAAVIHLIFNTFGTIIFIPFIPILSRIAIDISPGDVQRQVANVHTIFNIANTLIMLPLIKYLIALVNKLIPGQDEIEKMGPKYIDDRLLETPVIAAGQVIKETIRMANKAKSNLELAVKSFKENDEKIVNKVYENEKLINTLEECITNYLVKLSKCELSDKEQSIVASTFYIVNDIERIGDHVENIADLTTQKLAKKVEYTEDAMEELNNIYNYTLKALEIAIDSYEKRDVEEAQSINSVEKKIDEAQKEYRENHIKRLNQDKCSAYAGAIFMDLLSNFERIGDHSTNIAESVVGKPHAF